MRRAKKFGVTLDELLAVLARAEIEKNLLALGEGTGGQKIISPASSLSGKGPPITVRRGYKLLRVRRDGSLGPLFINCRQVIEEGIWLRSECHFKKGYKFRPGWHVAPRPEAPHLSTKGREWRHVEIADYEELPRPEAQGGTWWIARWMRVLPK